MLGLSQIVDEISLFPNKHLRRHQFLNVVELQQFAWALLAEFTAQAFTPSLSICFAETCVSMAQGLPIDASRRRRGLHLRDATEAILNHENNIVIFSSEATAHSPQLLGGCIAHSFTGFEEFKQVALKPSAFVVKSDSETYTRTLLRQIRRDPDNATSLVFTYGSIAENDEPLSDGPMPSTREALLNRIGDMQKRAQAMQVHGDHQTPEQRL